MNTQKQETYFDKVQKSYYNQFIDQGFFEAEDETIVFKGAFLKEAAQDHEKLLSNRPGSQGLFFLETLWEMECNARAIKIAEEELA